MIHKVDWLAVKARYEPLVSRLTDRYELDNLLSQMVGEMSALHTFVYGGDKRESSDNISLGSLGAEFDKTDRGFLIKHIYQNNPDNNLSSPLNKPELNIQAGDIITEVDNFSVKDFDDLGELLKNKVGVAIKLKILGKNHKISEQIVKPFSGYESYLLRYNEWEYMEKLKVDSAANNEIGYVHLKAMGGEDMDAFVRQYYPIFNRKGLIFDGAVETNDGGSVSKLVRGGNGAGEIGGQCFRFFRQF